MTPTTSTDAGSSPTSSWASRSAAATASSPSSAPPPGKEISPLCCGTRVVRRVKRSVGPSGRWSSGTRTAAGRKPSRRSVRRGRSARAARKRAVASSKVGVSGGGMGLDLRGLYGNRRRTTFHDFPTEANVRSDVIKKGYEKAPHRSLLRAVGLNDGDFAKPFIGIANSHVDIIPGHFFLQEYGRIAKDEIRKAGGVPFEFNTIGVDDGIAMGHAGMLYSLPSRELIADSVETMMNAHMLDALVCIPNCDKIVPGMLMGALRVDVPTVFVSGGPMRKGHLADGTPIDLTTAFEAVGKRARGQITDAELYEIECRACPSGGSCSGMFTANSMNVLCEAMGIALPGNGTALALTPEREALVRKAARRAVEIALDEKFRFRRIVNADAVHNAMVVDMAMGGSSNTVLHMLAIAREAGVEFDLRAIEEVARKVAHIAKIAPSLSTVHMEDIHRAGGVQAVLKEAARRGGIVREDALTVSGETVGERIRDARIADPAVIHTWEKAYSPVGGLAVLHGNLAPEGAVVKTAGIQPSMRKFT